MSSSSPVSAAGRPKRSHAASVSTSSGSALFPGPDSFGAPSFASRRVQSTTAGIDFAGTSRTRPPTQYANTCPPVSTSTTASGPFPKRGSATAGAAAGLAVAFFAAGCLDADGLVVTPGWDVAVRTTGGCWLFCSAVMATASGAAPVDRVRGPADPASRRTGAVEPVNVPGTGDGAAAAGTGAGVAG